MKIDRLLSIIVMLINRPLITARDLSLRYGVTIRTIYRDIQAIAAAGIPVISYQGKKGGFCLSDNYRIDRQLLSINDMTAILLALKGISTTFKNEDVNEAIEKIESLVPEDKKDYVQQQFENVLIDLSGWSESPDRKKNLQLTNRALSQRKLLYFTYRNLMGEESKRLIEPMTLILKMNIWYVYGFCRDKNDYRLFRLSRMSHCEINDQTFIRKNKVYNESDFFQNYSKNAIPIKIRFAPQAKNKIEEFFYGSVESISDDGFITVVAHYPEDEWVYSMLLSYGNDVEVISPLHLREKIISRIESTLQLYKQMK